MKKLLSIILTAVLLTACGRETPSPAGSAQPDNSASEINSVMFEDAQTIMENLNIYSQELCYIGEDIIENIQGEITNPSEGLNSRNIEKAEFSDVYIFELDNGTDKPTRYAVTKTGGILYINEAATNAYGRDDVWVALTSGFVPYDESAELPELVVFDISSAGLSYVLRNSTDKTFMYGSSYNVYVRGIFGWKPVKVIVNDGQLVFTSEGYNVMPQSQTVVRHVNFEWSFGELSRGEYKFIKDIMDFRATGDYDNYDLEQIFIIR